MSDFFLWLLGEEGMIFLSITGYSRVLFDDWAKMCYSNANKALQQTS